jgi:hypothetical protein
MEHLINWVEIPVKNMSRATKFYKSILGVELKKIEIGSIQYSLFPAEDNFNCGALAKSEYHTPSSDGITIYLNGGNDLNNILSKVNDAGGRVIMEKILLSEEAGYIGMFLDTEGNKIGLQNNN